MIDITKETLFTFPALAQHIPPRRDRRPVHVATIHRWRAKGIGGVRLEAIRCGGMWMSSLEALQRFCNSLTCLKEPNQIVQSVDPVITPNDEVERILVERFGF